MKKYFWYFSRDGRTTYIKGDSNHFTKDYNEEELKILQFRFDECDAEEYENNKQDSPIIRVYKKMLEEGPTW